MAIEVSGSYGSRQEEARLGRAAEAGENRAYFYALVTEESREEMFAIRRQLFLIEQGYEYHAIQAKHPAFLDMSSMRHRHRLQIPDGKEASWR